jgi:hypothetical protein
MSQQVSLSPSDGVPLVLALVLMSASGGCVELSVFRAEGGGEEEFDSPPSVETPPPEADDDDDSLPPEDPLEEDDAVLLSFEFPRSMTCGEYGPFLRTRHPGLAR